MPSYSTLWFLDEYSLGNITDIVKNGKDSNVSDVLQIKNYLKSMQKQNDENPDYWKGFQDNV